MKIKCIEIQWILRMKANGKNEFQPIISSFLGHDCMQLTLYQRES